MVGRRWSHSDALPRHSPGRGVHISRDTHAYPQFPYIRILISYRLILCQRVRRANSGGSRSPERTSKCVWDNFSSTSGDLPSGL